MQRWDPLHKCSGGFGLASHATSSDLAIRDQSRSAVKPLMHCTALENGQAWIFGLRLTLAHAWAPGTTYCVQRLCLVLSLRPPDHVSFKPCSILHRYNALQFVPAGGRRGGGRVVGWRHSWDLGCQVGGSAVSAG